MALQSNLRKKLFLPIMRKTVLIGGLLQRHEKQRQIVENNILVLKSLGKAKKGERKTMYQHPLG